MIDMRKVPASNLTDTQGAVDILEERTGRDYTPDTIHNLVRSKKLTAYVFVKGELQPRPEPSEENRRVRQGQGLIFIKEDLYKIDLPDHDVGRKQRVS